MSDNLEIYVDGKRSSLFDLLSDAESVRETSDVGSVEVVQTGNRDIETGVERIDNILDDMARGIVEVDDELAEMMRKMGREEFGIRDLWALAVVQELVSVVKGKRKGGSTLSEIGKMLGYGAKKEGGENSRIAEAFIRAVGEVASSLLEQREGERKIVDGEVKDDF